MKSFSLKFCIALVSLVVASGCATGMPTIHTKVNPELVKFSDENGYVYFFRPCVMWGAARGLTVFKEEQKIGDLNCGNYLIYEAPPGIYKFRANDWLRKNKVLELNVQAGEKYFIKSDLKLGIIDAKPSLTLIEYGGLELVSKLKLVNFIPQAEGE